MNYSQDFDGNEIESTSVNYPDYAVIFNRGLFGNQGIVIDRTYLERKYLGTGFGFNIRNGYATKLSMSFNSIWLIGAKKTLGLMPDDNLFYLLDSRHLHAFSYNDFELTEFHSQQHIPFPRHAVYERYNHIEYLEKETTVFTEFISINMSVEINEFYHNTGAHDAMVWEFRDSIGEELEMIKKRLTRERQHPTWKPTERPLIT